MTCASPSSRVRRDARSGRSSGRGRSGSRPLVVSRAFTGGDTKRVDATVKNVDIVFVVTEDAEMEFAKTKIVEVARKLEQSLTGFKYVSFCDVAASIM